MSKLPQDHVKKHLNHMFCCVFNIKKTIFIAVSFYICFYNLFEQPKKSVCMFYIKALKPLH